MAGFFKRMFGEEKDDVSVHRGASVSELQIATAALLLEIAAADDKFTDDERDEIINSLKRHFNLSANQVEDILAMTKEEMNQRIDMYYFTSRLNDNLNREQKMEIMEMVWRVIYTDKILGGHEDHLVHRLAKLLRLEHSQMIEAKLRVKRELLP